MSDLDNIIQVSISRETKSVARANFGTPAVIAEFATSKTTPAFSRIREYGSLAEMIAEGWSNTDAAYLAARAVFSQNPSPVSVKVGRKDAADANWGAALDAIAAEDYNWYGFGIRSTSKATVLYSDDFVTGNAIALSVNGEAITPVNFTTDQATTLAALAAQIEADITDASVTVGTRSVIIEVFGVQDLTVTSTVTGGATQATASVGYTVEDDLLAAAAWAETQMKLFFLFSNDAGIITSSTTDLFSDLKALGYDRTVMLYHPDADGDNGDLAWLGECLPFDPGSQTWAYKTLSGVVATDLATAQANYAFGKNGNTYQAIAGVSITRYGKVASGEYIDVMRGVDWIQATIQETIFAGLVNSRKIPFTDLGTTQIEGYIREVLGKAAGMGIITKESIEVVVPKVADVSAADKANRLLPDVTFRATLQGAIHKTEIQGVVAL